MVTPAPAATQTIQAILTPAVMISASALLLLGLNARYVAILSAIRALNAEKRKLAEDLENCLTTHSHSESSPQANHCQLERGRLRSVSQQLATLIRTSWCIRNSILCHVAAILFFVLTSCSIGLEFLLNQSGSSTPTLFLFMIAILLLLSGIIFFGIDILISYSVILVEVTSEKQ